MNKEYLFIIEDRVMISNNEFKHISKGYTYLLGPLLDRYYNIIRIQLDTGEIMYNKIKEHVNKIKVLNIVIQAHGIEINNNLFICGETQRFVADVDSLFSVKKLFLLFSLFLIPIRVLFLTCYSIYSQALINILPKNSYIVTVGALNYNYNHRNVYFVKASFFKNKTCNLIKLAYYDQVSKIIELRDPNYAKEYIKVIKKNNKGIIVIKEITSYNYKEFDFK